MKKLLLIPILLVAGQAFAATPVLMDFQSARELHFPALRERADLGVSLVNLTESEMEKLSAFMHKKGRCGGFEVVKEVLVDQQGAVRVYSNAKIDQVFAGLEAAKAKDAATARVKKTLGGNNLVDYDPAIAAAIAKVRPEEVRSWIEWLQGFGGRYHNSSDPNRHTRALKERLEQMAASVSYPVTVELVGHQSSPQNSVKLRIEGRTRPNEIVVMGGHLDSINQYGMNGRNDAPGADDNASGSSSLLAALRVLLEGPQPERTIEFFWYAAEEVGLYGSAEIAQSYSNAQKDVVGVLQLDMTYFPGSGEFTISSISDYTSTWLRQLLEDLNRHYLNARIVYDECGYACSDHASWYRRGFSTLMPFEALTQNMNRNIHTNRDTTDAGTSDRHAAKFAEVAVAYAMTLANSDLRGDRQR